jgi:hypothetical protein
VVGILILRFEMYTGTLIEDLLRTVEQAEHEIQQKCATQERDWQKLFELPGSEQREQIFAGAA